jgi:hypothetical protein
MSDPTLSPDAPTLPPDPAAPAPTIDRPSIPGYEIIRELGRGGKGVVYQARQTKLGRVVALKMILSGAHASPDDLARFKTEAEASARLQHPNIVQIHEVGEHGGLPYFSLEFCGGGSLEKKLNGTPLPPREAAALVETLAGAMQAAHDKGVIHRDLKPANVLMTEDGTPKVTDFGLAKKLDEAGQTGSSVIMGTPSYMAPEQAGYKPDAQARRIGPAADVYALGAILYECLTGRPPFKAATVLDTILQVVSDEPVPPTQLQSKTPRDLETVCLKCLRKDPARRYASAAALADDLARFLKGEPIRARPVGALERATKWARRRPAAAALLAVSAFAGLTVVGVVGTAAALVYDKNRELSEANVQLTDERNRARTAEEDALTQKADAIAAKDDLANTLARSVLRPLALQGNQPLIDPEWDALWELATNRHQGRVGYRFVEVASRSPVGSRQLRDRAALALSAAVGLDEERRAEVEKLLMARLDDPALPDEQKTDLALAAAMWDGLSGPAAGRTARRLTRAMKDTKDSNALRWLADGLSALAGRLEPRDAAPVALALAQAIKDNQNDSEAFGWQFSALSALAARLEPSDAGPVAAALAQAIKDTKNPYTLQVLASGLSVLAGRLEARDAAAVTAPAAAALAQAIKDNKDGFALQGLASGLSMLAVRLESKDAAPAATALAQAMLNTNNPLVVRSLALGLSAMASHLGPKDAAAVTAPAAAALAKAIKDSKDRRDFGALEELAERLSALAGCLAAKDAAAATAPAAAALTQAIKDTKDPYALRLLALALSALTARLEARDAAPAAAALAQAMKDTKDPGALQGLASGLSALAGRLEAREAAPAAAALAQAIKDNKLPYAFPVFASGLSALAGRLEAREAAAVTAPAAAALAQAIKDNKDPFALQGLASGLSMLAVRLESKDAAPAAAALAEAIKDNKGPGGLGDLAISLSALTARLEARDAAPAAAALAQAMKDTKDPGALQGLASGLSALAGRLEAREAAPAAAALAQAIKANKNPDVSKYLWQGLPPLAARLEPKDASPAAAAFAQAVYSHLPGAIPSPAQSLSAVLSPVASADIPSRSALAATAVAAPPGTGHTLPALAFLIAAAEPPACRLSDQQLVELLKKPPFVGEARRVVLDQLGNRHHRTFADVWEFVRFAKEQRLGLDFTTPPQRPDTAGPAATKP